jgi:hypothetical protein
MEPEDALQRSHVLLQILIINLILFSFSIHASFLIQYHFSSLVWSFSHREKDKERSEINKMW